MNRVASLKRTTSESTIAVSIDLDGQGQSSINTGVGFYDHMLTALSRHSLIDMDIHAEGDLHIDGHHVVEDTAITLGQAIDTALGDRRGVSRFGQATIPLDESLASCVVDLSGRGFAVCSGEPDAQVYARIGGSGVPYQGSMTAHVVQSLALNAKACVHLTLLAGRDPHHIVEAQFKALARALRFAVELDPRVTEVPSTKGSL
ncbi:MAG: imidazoleglycerol-phosphate dehydratase HisB [Propionibacteriaceae bacterium]|jgi:imidazoleglycerol-phosphate dehydratase|nr:imidazoleglycerol-phosphate dehydratase HisB [Propionibacteriaceae bacterium]